MRPAAGRRLRQRQSQGRAGEPTGMSPSAIAEDAMDTLPHSDIHSPIAAPAWQGLAEAPFGVPQVEDQQPGRIDELRARALSHGVQTLGDIELLEVLLARAGVVSPRERALALLRRFGSLLSVMSASLAELSLLLPHQAVLDIKLLYDAGRRVALAPLSRRCALSSWNAVVSYLRLLLAGQPREQFWVLFLDRKNQLIASEMLAEGTIDHAPVYPREVLRRALELNSANLVLVHNHPSGDPSPSRPDIEMTRQISKAAKTLGLTVHDHAIVGHERVTSLRSEGLM